MWHFSEEGDEISFFVSKEKQEPVMDYELAAVLLRITTKICYENNFDILKMLSPSEADDEIH
jgi:hypothetical protein